MTRVPLRVAEQSIAAAGLVDAPGRTYLGDVPPPVCTLMADASHRYRLTVTPIEKDGLPCQGRCTLEFEHADHDNWTRILENVQRVRGLSGDERVALIVGTRLLGGLMLAHRKDEDDFFAALRPAFSDFIAELKQRAGHGGTDASLS